MSRIDRINSELRQLISVIVQQKLNDPRIEFVTVTSVSTSADLRHATIYFTCMGPEEKKKEALKALNKSCGYIKKLLSEDLRIKFMPDIKFIYDDTAQQEEKIDKLFDQLHKEGETK